MGLNFKNNNSKLFLLFFRKYHLYTDQLKLERILYNLLNNSYRHILPGGKLVLDVIHDISENGFYFSV